MSAPGLLAVNLLLAGALLVLPWTGTLVGDWSRAARGSGPLIESLSLLSAFTVQTIAAAGVLLLLTSVQSAALRVAGLALGWHCDRRTPWAVCCHASYGWIFLGLLPVLMLAVVYTLGTLLRISLPGVAPSPSAGGRVSWQLVFSVALPALGYACGLLVSPWFACAGLRINRFTARA